MVVTRSLPEAELVAAKVRCPLTAIVARRDPGKNGRCVFNF